MNIIKLKNISDYEKLKKEILFLLCEKKYIIIDFLDFKWNLQETYDFLKNNFLQNQIKIKNLPFCINNFYFENLENSYNFSYVKECSYCNFWLNCKGKSNFYFTPKSIELFESKNYRKKYLIWIKIIQNFLLSLWYKQNEIVFWEDKHSMIYYFLFENFNIFFNWNSKKYFFESSQNRIFISVFNEKLNKKYFLNSWKNLLFKNDIFLQKYIKIMDLIWFDIVIYSWQKYYNIIDKKNIYFYNNYFILSKILSEFSYKNIQNIKWKTEFNWKKIINNSWRKVLKWTVINIKDIIWDKNNLPKDFILIGVDTMPKFLDLIIKSTCIILEINNDLSHWVIMSRELKKDSIYWVKWITEIKTWKIIEVDFEKNIIKVI